MYTAIFLLFVTMAMYGNAATDEISRTANIISWVIFIGAGCIFVGLKLLIDRNMTNWKKIAQTDIETYINLSKTAKEDLNYLRSSSKLID